MSLNPPVLYFDLVDPLSLLASAVMDQAEVSEAVSWRGLELRPPPAALIDPTTAEWRARRDFAARQAERLTRPAGPLAHASAGTAGIARIGNFTAARSPTIVPWTRKAHELCEFARERDCLHAVRRALFRAHFIDRIDIGRIDLLVEVARRAGLDASETRAVLDVDRYTGAVLGNRNEALTQGVADVPALVLNEGRLEGTAVLSQIERAIELLTETAQANREEE
ncbi:MAG: hypothetical protein F4187_04780 [Gemmatimonadetes bacterium]|nr:hypothetical protein [Gemmatimonadota bacterium]MYI07481.1 hypothetical protein [Gemmatimonadota bacterium]